MADMTNPDDESPAEPEALDAATEQVPAADAATAEDSPVEDGPVEATPAQDASDAGSSEPAVGSTAPVPDPASRSARRKLWTVAAAAAAVGVIGGVAVGAVGAEVLEEDHYDERGGSAQGWDRGPGGKGSDERHGGYYEDEDHYEDEDDYEEQDVGEWGGRGGPAADPQGGQPGGMGGEWGPGAGHSRSGGS